MILGEVDRSIGITGDAASKIKCNYIAFADDLLLMSTTDVGMKILLMQLEGEMEKVGLVMNPNKCASMCTEINIARRLWIVNPEPYLSLRDGEIKALNIFETFKYLVVEIGARSKYSTIAEQIQKDLHSISRAPSETISAALHPQNSSHT